VLVHTLHTMVSAGNSLKTSSGNHVSTINTIHYELSFTYHTTKAVANVKHKKGAKQ